MKIVILFLFGLSIFCVKCEVQQCSQCDSSTMPECDDTNETGAYVHPTDCKPRGSTFRCMKEVLNYPSEIKGRAGQSRRVIRRCEALPFNSNKDHLGEECVFGSTTINGISVERTICYCNSYGCNSMAFSILPSLFGTFLMAIISRVI